MTVLGNRSPSSSSNSNRSRTQKCPSPCQIKLFGSDRVDLKERSGRKRNLFAVDIPLSSACLTNLLHSYYFVGSRMRRELCWVPETLVGYPCCLGVPGGLLGRGGTEYRWRYSIGEENSLKTLVRGHVLLDHTPVLMTVRLSKHQRRPCNMPGLTMRQGGGRLCLSVDPGEGQPGRGPQLTSRECAARVKSTR